MVICSEEIYNKANRVVRSYGTGDILKIACELGIQMLLSAYSDGIRHYEERRMSSMENCKANYISIPETYTRRQLNALYREIPLKDATSRTLRKYFNAMANLYGVISLRKAFEIISSQSPRLVNEAEFLAYAEVARQECEDYFILGEDEIYTDGKTASLFDCEIIDTMLFDENIEQYIRTKQSQRGKPFYIPDKKKLLLYEDAFYCDETSETTALRTFLKDRFELTETQELAIFAEILYGSRYLNREFADVMNRLGEIGLVFETDADLQKFIDLHQQFHNTTRMQCNRGYTPEELFWMQPREERIPKSISLGSNIRKLIAEGTINVDELRSDILTMEMPSEELRFSLLKEIADVEKSLQESKKPKKVGRNDPCPCGSGKKYKKCCGR